MPCRGQRPGGQFLDRVIPWFHFHQRQRELEGFLAAAATGVHGHQAFHGFHGCGLQLEGRKKLLFRILVPGEPQITKSQQ